MTVEQFVAARKEAWQRLSGICDRIDHHGVGALEQSDLASFGAVYRQTASDLSYARAHIGELELTSYLNALVTRAHGHLYTPRRRGVHGFASAVGGYPGRWRAARPFLLVSAALFLGAVVASWAMVAFDERNAVLFVPPEIRESMEAGPAGDVGIPASLFAALSGFILTNNLTAALLAFAGGVFFGLGTIERLVRNGLLIGALGGLTQVRAPMSLVTFAAYLLPHGVLELTALVTTGAAGLMLGHSLLAGGRLTRREALLQAGREAFPLLAGALAWFGVAALIEGFVTPLGVPDGVKLSFALLSGGLLVWYLRQ